jgi:alpha-tubulin suppressor-like RCC1 family protein
VAGVASFADLIIDAAGSGYTLAASATGLAAVVSTAFDVTALHVPGTVSWNDPAGGPWTDGSRWSGGVTPGPGDTVLISLPGTFTVVANTSIEVALLVVGGGAGAQTLQIGSSALTATDSVHVAPTGRLEVVGSTSLGAAPLAVEGTLDLVAGALTVAGGFAMTDGSVLRGNGTLDLSSASAGAFDADVRPGASPGILTVVGDLTLSSASTLTLELDGTTAGTAHDRLDVSGTLTLGGTLEVVVGAGYTPSPADTLVVLTYAAIVGAFADTTGLTPSGMTFATGTSSAEVRGPAPMPATWTAVSVGASHSCGLVSGGVAYCWGRNALSQLGTNSQIDLWAPTKVVTPVRFQSLAAGVHNTCGVALDGIGWCWGLSAQTGTGSSAGSAQPVPVQISGGHTFQRIEHGSGQTACGLTTAGELYCWGENAFGQVGDGTTDHHPSPTLVALPGPVLSFTVGGTHACAVLVSSAGYCWGDGSLGQLGEATPASLTPLASSAAANAVALSSGGNVTCALRANQTVECWGSGLFNGTASNASTHVPASIENVGNVISIAQHSGASCVVATDAKGHCWGDNFANALGLGAGFVGQGLVAVPQPMTGGLDFAAVSTGNYHGCGLTTDGGMYCWGDNQFGQLGVHLANDDLHTPIEVTPPS